MSRQSYAILIKLRLAHPRIPMELLAHQREQGCPAPLTPCLMFRCSPHSEDIPQDKPTMAAMTLEAMPHIAMPAPKTISGSSPDNEFRAETKCAMGRSDVPATRSSSLSCALDLSKSRANDAVLDILKAYKLTGNFH